MRLNGVPITTLSLGHLSVRLRNAGHQELAQRLSTAIGFGEVDVTVSGEERAAILAVLETPHPSLVAFKNTLSEQR
jgi:hypothetical protein